MQTVTIDQDGVYIVLARSTVADARVRRGMFNMLPEVERTGEKATLMYFVTQIVECKGLPFGKVLSVPDEDDFRDMLDEWDTCDEIIYYKIVDAINVLRGDADQKKSDPSAKS